MQLAQSCDMLYMSFSFIQGGFLMSTLLEQLGNDTLPATIEREFVDWCLWQQAYPALQQVLEKTLLTELVEMLSNADKYFTLVALTDIIVQEAQAARKRTGLLGLSAAQAAAIEFQKLLAAASEEAWDPQEVAFFSVRVCGWAGWANSEFSDTENKDAAERAARSHQEAHLKSLFSQQVG